jgi:hypothetical protein
MSVLEATADRPGKTIYTLPSEGGAFVLLYVATSPDLFDRSGQLDLSGEHVQLTPDEGRTVAQTLNDAADEVDLGSA